MREMRIALTALTVVALTVLFLGCEEELVPPDISQEEWTEMGWDAWTGGDFDTAARYFGNALKVDGNYMPAYNGFGWTHMRNQEPSTAIDYFEDGILYGAGESNGDMNKRALYVGLAYVLEADDDFDASVDAGEEYLDMDPPPATSGGAGGSWKLKYDERITAYDAYIVLAVDYFALGNAGKCVEMVNYMRRMLTESDYTFTNWSALAAEIERLVAADPT